MAGHHRAVTHPLVEQLRFTRAEWRRALRGVPEEDGFRRFGPVNSIGWIVAHLGWQEQRYFVVRPQGRTPLPELDEIAPSGGPASTPSLTAMLALWKRATAEADRWLDGLDTRALLAPLPPPGGSRTAGDAIHRVTYHYWQHIGEIMAIRQLLDHPRRPEFVGDIETRAPYRPEPPAEGPSSA
jgi:hypothetical protein